MRVGFIGASGIARKHAQAYKNIGYQITAATDRTEERGQRFADAWGAEFVATPEELSQRADVDFLDVCTFPGYRLAAVELGAKYGKHVLVEKPMAVDLETAARMIELARAAGIQLGVVSQHRFDDSTLFLKRAIAGRQVGYDPPGRCLCEVVPHRRILCAAGEGKLGRRRRRRADQPGHPPGGRAAVLDGRGG